MPLLYRNTRNEKGEEEMICPQCDHRMLTHGTSSERIVKSRQDYEYACINLIQGEKYCYCLYTKDEYE